MENQDNLKTGTKPFVRKLTLFSVLPQHMLLSQQDSGVLAEPSDRGTLQNLWNRANKEYTNSSNPARSFITNDDIKPVETEPETINEILERIKVYPPYDSHQTTICNVRISKLVTPQIAVNIQRSLSRASVKDDMSSKELLDLAFQPSQNHAPITRQIMGINPNGGTLLFTSYDEDVALHQPPRYHNLPLNGKDTDGQSLENVCFPVGGRPPFAASYLVQLAPNIHRLILANGIHRIYRLALAGYEWCPIAVTNFTPIEIGDPFVDMPRALLLDPNANPPLITDFLNENIVIPLNYFTTLKTIHFTWSINQSLTVVK